MASAPDFLKVISVGFTNSYALDSGDGLMLIDTGINTDANWDLLTSGLRDAGTDVKHVRKVLLTHSHFDHSGMAARVREASGAQVLIHRADAPFLNEEGGWSRQGDNIRRLLIEHGVPVRLLDWFEKMGETRGRGWFRDWRKHESLFDDQLNVRWDMLEHELTKREEQHTEAAGHSGEYRPASGNRDNHVLVGFVQPKITPDGTFEDDEIISLNGLSVRAVHTPGHTPGHACFVHEEAGLIFTGDHVLKRITPHPGIVFHGGRYDDRTRSLPAYMSSLDKIRDLDIRRVLPAHEDEPEFLHHSVDRILKHHERRAAQAREALQHGRTTAFEVLPYLFPNLRAFAVWTAVPEVIGHLDILEERGEASSTLKDGSMRYRLVGN